MAQATSLIENDSTSGAVSLLIEPCERFHRPACRVLGVLKRDGAEDTESIPESAEALLLRAAVGMDKEATYELGLLYRDGLTVQANPESAATQFEIACRRDHAAACYHLGMLLTQGALPVDTDKAGMAFLTGCGLGEGSSCWNVASLAQQGLFTLPDDLTVEGLLERACAQGAESSCGE